MEPAFFINYLHKIYCAKTHLAERLPELAEQALFSDLKYAVLETADDVARQVERIEAIYLLLHVAPAFDHCNSLIDFLEDGFDEIHQTSRQSKSRDLAILFYMTMLESIEMASFRLLISAAPDIAQPVVTQLLQESYDESRADRTLFKEITARYA